jgi:hypothetical protein
MVAGMSPRSPNAPGRLIRSVVVIPTSSRRQPKDVCHTLGVTKPETITLVRTEVRLRGSRTAPAVEIRDAAAGVQYTVAPVVVDGLTELRHYAETALVGVLPELQAKPLPRAYLAEIALEVLEGTAHGGRVAVRHENGELWMLMGKRRPDFKPDAERLPRPDDERLVDVIRRYQAGHKRGGLSPRIMLAERYGIKPYTADDWIRRARDLAPDFIEPPATGRGHKKESNR